MTDYTEWLSKYLTGVEVVDRQHLALAENLNEIELFLETPGGQEGLDKVLADLIGYFQKHFVDEEELLKEHPDIAIHHREHEKFIIKIKEYAQEVLVNRKREVAGDMLSFLYVWFLKHTLKMDKVYFAQLG